MIEIIESNYSTYISAKTGRMEKHAFRLFLFSVSALFASIFSSGGYQDAFPMMATGITILTGFSFTALFSESAQADVGLPRAKNETDIADIRRLGILAKNFQSRTLYFVVISITEVCLLVLISLDLAVPELVTICFQQIINWLSFSPELIVFLISAMELFQAILIALAFFIFLECLYTFYRLTETITAILTTRRDYLKTGK